MLLQFIIKDNNADTIRSAAHQALEAGINWIEIDAPPQISDDTLTSVVEDLRKELADRGCMLIIGSRYALAKKIQADGVHIYKSDRPLSAVRSEIEAWPVIGVNVNSKADAEAYRALDIDYLFFNSDGTPESLDTIQEITSYLDENAIETPLVCGGNITPTNAITHVQKGVTALATSDLSTLQELKHITDNATPVNV